jgi:hypothetical protein
MSIERFVLDSKKAELKKPTHEATVVETEYGNQHIGVGIVDTREKNPKTGKLEGKTIVWPMSYLARLDDFEKQRLVTIAEELKQAGEPVRILAPELPGVGMSEEANMTLSQKLNLLRGNFDGSAFAMLGAMDEAIGSDWGDEVDLALYSQGAVLGSSMAKQLSEHAHGINVKVGKTTIIEDVNDTRLNLGLLKIGGEDTDASTKVKSGITDRYLNENKRWSWLVAPADRADLTQNSKRVVDLRSQASKPNAPKMKKHFDIIQTERRTDGGKEKREKLDKLQKAPLILGGLALILSSIRNNLYTARKNNSLDDVNILKFDDSQVSSLKDNIETIEGIKNSKESGRADVTLVTAPEGQKGHRHPAVHSMANMGIISKEILKK